MYHLYTIAPSLALHFILQKTKTKSRTVKAFSSLCQYKKSILIIIYYVHHPKINLTITPIPLVFTNNFYNHWKSIAEIFYLILSLAFVKGSMFACEFSLLCLKNLERNYSVHSFTSQVLY